MARYSLFVIPEETMIKMHLNLQIISKIIWLKDNNGHDFIYFLDINSTFVQKKDI